MHVVIIGNGIAGITAAITIRKLCPDFQITVISAETDYHYSRTALMYLYMGHMAYRHVKPYGDWFWPENRINLVRDEVTQIDFDARQLHLAAGNPISYGKLLLATGSVYNRLPVPGHDLPGVQGLYGLPDLELMEQQTAGIQRAVVVGGGLIGIELVEMLYTRCIPITFLIREPHFWGRILPAEEALMVENHIREHGVDLQLDTTAQTFTAGPDGRVAAVETSRQEKIPCQFVGVAIGVKPNIAFLQNTALHTNLGIQVNEFLETNLPDVYAAGDCAELNFRGPGEARLEQVWYTGRMQGQTVAHNICGNRLPYQPGTWFNSAKFFDLEYQTYGQVPAVLPENQRSLIWQHPQQKKLLRLNFMTDTGEVTGFNLLGIRYRQEVCTRWIDARKDVHYVIAHLKEANFDPEFHRRYEKEITRHFKQQLALNPTLNQ